MTPEQRAYAEELCQQFPYKCAPSSAVEVLRAALAHIDALEARVAHLTEAAGPMGCKPFTLGSACPCRLCVLERKAEALAAERDALRAEYDAALTRDHAAITEWQARAERAEQRLDVERREWWRHRDVDEPCETCHGAGTRMYANTSTWRGGIGGNAMTLGLCDQCWGSGDKHHPLPSLRQAERTAAARLELLNAAVPAMHAYARENPKHFWGLEPQDPNGVHVWLDAYAANVPTKEEV